MTDTSMDIQKSLDDAQDSLSKYIQPSSIPIRTLALTLAQKHQSSAMPSVVVDCAVIFEQFLLGKWSTVEKELKVTQAEVADVPEEPKAPAGFTECYLDVMNPAGRIRMYSKEFECDESSRTGKFLLQAAGAKEFINLLNNIHKSANLPSAVHQYGTDEEGFESVYAFSILKFGKPQLQAHDTVLLEFSYRDRIKIS